MQQPTTPYLLVDLDALSAQYQRLAQAFADIDLHYAMKCNPHPEILRCVHQNGGKFEIASIDELLELQKIGVKPRDVLFSNPVKIAPHIQQAAKAGLNCFAFDSTDELHKLAQYAPQAQVYVRLATVDADSNVPSEGKFGVDSNQAYQLLMQARDLGLQPYGIAFHVGSQMLNPEAWATAIQTSGQLLKRLQSSGITLAMLDIGGGYPADYDGEQQDITAITAVIHQALTAYLPYPPQKLAAEPGRSLVANAGTMVTTVIGRAERRGKQWVHLDVGAFNGMMEALETQNKLRFPLSDSRASTRKQQYVLTGPSCDSQDTILHDALLSAGLRSGDTVYIHAAGAYTTSYASRFNGFDIPPVVIKTSSML